MIFATKEVIRHRAISRGIVIFMILKGLYSPAAYARAQVVDPVGKQNEKPEATVMQTISPRGSIPPATAMAATRGVNKMCIRDSVCIGHAECVREGA